MPFCRGGVTGVGVITCLEELVTGFPNVPAGFGSPWFESVLLLAVFLDVSLILFFSGRYQRRKRLSRVPEFIHLRLGHSPITNPVFDSVTVV